MAVVTDQFRSFSKLKYEEYLASVGGMLGSMSEAEQEVFYELLCAEDLGLELEMRSVEYDREMVDIQVWLDDPYFMGESTKSLYGVWRDDLIELFASKQYSTCLVVGSLGSGKSTFAHFAIARMIYEISCLRDPQKTYDLSSGSEIVFVNLAPVKETARKVLFEGVLSKINQSPYFMNEFSPINKRSKDLYNFKSFDVTFPKCISLVSGSSTDSSFLGRNVIGGVIDELNFFHADPKYLALRKKTERWGEFSKAGKLFDSIMRRMKSRFLKRGRLPGILIGTSSKTTESSLTSRLINDAVSKHDSTMFVRDRAIIDVKANSFSDKKFKILVGNAFYHSRILKNGEDLSEIESLRVIDIPEDLRTDFENDINAALRDLAGIDTLAIDLFFSNIEKIHACVDRTRKHPFCCWAMEDNGWWDSKSSYTIDWKVICRRIDNGDWIPKLDPDRPRFVHLDPALTGDAFGLSIVHVKGYQKVERKVPDKNEVYEELLPVFVVDFMLKIAGSKDDEIQFKNVRQIIYQFSEHGFQISKVTSDKFQSREMLQQLESQGYSTELISVDEDIEPYAHFRRVVYDERISYYHYSSLIDEMIKLESIGNKVDHPRTGCFVGETRIPLLDGTCPMISELEGKSVWVYSCRSEGVIVPGLARGRLTKFVNEIIEIILDSGAVIRCTPEHPFMLRDGTYKMAKYLIPGMDRLMPIARHWPVNGGYESCSCLGRKTLTHHMVIKGLGEKIPKDYLVHHKNGNKVDNIPENLVVEYKKEHAKKHTTKRHEFDLEYKEKIAKGLKKFNDSDEGRRKHSEAVRKTVAQMTKDERQQRARAHLQFRSDITIREIETARDEPSVWNAGNAAIFLKCGRNVVMRVLKDNGYSSWEEFETARESNHKVRWIFPVKLSNPIPVYDLEVDEWSNFALAAGVFVHNSKDIADSLCGVLWALYLDGNYGNVILPQKGFSNSDGEEFFDENFNDMKKEESPLRIVYTKPSDKSVLKPSYKKVKLDKNQDISDSIFDLGIFMERG